MGPEWRPLLLMAVFVKTVVPLGSKEKMLKFFCYVILMPLLQIGIQFMIPSDT